MASFYSEGALALCISSLWHTLTLSVLVTIRNMKKHAWTLSEVVMSLDDISRYTSPFF